jgi:hypothetical protein
LINFTNHLSRKITYHATGLAIYMSSMSYQKYYIVVKQGNIHLISQTSIPLDHPFNWAFTQSVIHPSTHTISQSLDNSIIQTHRQALIHSVQQASSQNSFFNFYFSSSHLEHRASVKRFVSLQFLNLRQSVGLLGLGIGLSQGRYLTQTQNKHRHPCLERDSNPRSQCSSGRRHFMSQTVRPLRLTAGRITKENSYLGHKNPLTQCYITPFSEFDIKRRKISILYEL